MVTKLNDTKNEVKNRDAVHVYDINCTQKHIISTINPMNYWINLIYSIGDDVLKTTDTLGHEVSYEYDILHNQIKKIDANSNIK